MSIVQIEAVKPTINTETLFNIFGFPVTNSVLMIWLITIIIFILSLCIAKKAKIIPARWQVITEYLYEAMHGLVDTITGSSAITKKIFYIIGSLFIFIGFSNLLGIFIPFLGSFTYEGKAMFRTPTTDFKIHYKDKIMAYGKEEVIANLAKREKGKVGKMLREEAVELNKKFSIIKKIDEQKLKIAHKHSKK